jgi:hypothetical protein
MRRRVGAAHLPIEKVRLFTQGGKRLGIDAAHPPVKKLLWLWLCDKHLCTWAGQGLGVGAAHQAAVTARQRQEDSGWQYVGDGDRDRGAGDAKDELQVWQIDGQRQGAHCDAWAPGLADI